MICTDTSANEAIGSSSGSTPGLLDFVIAPAGLTEILHPCCSRNNSTKISTVYLSFPASHIGGSAGMSAKLYFRKSPLF